MRVLALPVLACERCGDAMVLALVQVCRPCRRRIGAPAIAFVPSM